MFMFIIHRHNRAAIYIIVSIAAIPSDDMDVVGVEAVSEAMPTQA